MWRDFRYFWLISRPLNVLISLLAFAISCFLANDRSLTFLLDVPFWGTAFTILIIAATGYWINDVHDYRIDRINKPDKAVVNAILSVKKVLTVYFLFTLVILLFSFGYLGWHLFKFHITFINFLSVLLLFIYASHLKRVSVAGNLVIAFLTALVLILAFYLYPVDPRDNMAPIWAIVFAFEITLIREIVKDVEDIPGDLKFGLRTLPIQIGIRNTKKVLMGLYVIFLLSCYAPIVLEWWRDGAANWGYGFLSLTIVQIPCLWLIRFMWQSTEPVAFGQQSRYLKYLILTGMLTLFLLN